MDFRIVAGSRIFRAHGVSCPARSGCSTSGRADSAESGAEIQIRAKPRCRRQRHEASSHGSPLTRISDLTTHWLLGSAVTPDQELSPLTNDERLRIYLRQTYFHAGTYAKRLAGAGIDQARGVPDAWGGGFPRIREAFCLALWTVCRTEHGENGGRCGARVRTTL